MYMISFPKFLIHYLSHKNHYRSPEKPETFSSSMYCICNALEINVAEGCWASSYLIAAYHVDGTAPV